MSATANWSYTNIATVRPFVSIDMRTGETVYGPEFDICLLYTSDAADE